VNSPLPAGHYQNMIAAIKKLAVASEAARLMSASAVERHNQKRLDALRKMESDRKLTQPQVPHGT
jgi:hypothetical protein